MKRPGPMGGTGLMEPFIGEGIWRCLGVEVTRDGSGYLLEGINDPRLLHRIRAAAGHLALEVEISPLERSESARKN